MNLDDLLDELPNNNLHAIDELCVNYIELLKFNELEYLDKIEFYTIITRYIDIHGLKIYNLDLDFKGTDDDAADILKSIHNIRRSVTRLRAEEAAERAKNSIDNKFGLIKNYTLEDNDIETIQNTINELREIINESDQLDNKQKGQLLKQLEKMQSTLHKVVLDFNPFWGFWADAGFALRQFDQNGAPFLDRVERIMKIVFNVQAQQEVLPSSFEFPKLTSSDADSDE